MVKKGKDREGPEGENLSCIHTKNRRRGFNKWVQCWLVGPSLSHVGLYAGVSVTMHLTYSEVFLSYRWIRNKFALDSYSIINIHIRKDNK